MKNEHKTDPKGKSNLKQDSGQGEGGEGGQGETDWPPEEPAEFRRVIVSDVLGQLWLFIEGAGWIRLTSEVIRHLKLETLRRL